MQQLYQLNFQKIYLQLKEKREDGYTRICQPSKTVHEELKHRATDTHPAHYMVHKCAKLQRILFRV